MSTQICSYFLCGRSIRNTAGLRRFRFPTGDPERCMQWIANCGNPSLASLSLEELSRKMICQYHFQKKDFLSFKLASGAVPIKYKSNFPEKPKILFTYGKSRRSNATKKETITPSTTAIETENRLGTSATDALPEKLSKEDSIQTDTTDIQKKTEKEIILHKQCEESDRRKSIVHEDKASTSTSDSLPVKKRNITILYGMEAECIIETEAETSLSRRSVALQTNLRPKYESKSSQCNVSKCL